MIAFTALSLLATAVLVAGRDGVIGLYIGRLLTGVVSGTVFTVGTAWVKELSADAPELAARRAAVALTAGFGVGPLVSGVLAQWAPQPTVEPYLVPLVLGAVALGLLFRAPETRPRTVGQPLRILPAAARSRRFLRVVAPMAPFVFGSVTLAFTTLPAHGTRPPQTAAIVFTGVLAAAALAAGLVGQRLGRRLQGISRGPIPGPAVAGLGIVTLGYLLTALATAHPGLVAGSAAALALGGGYGVCLVVGLREVERLAAPDELGSLVAVYYSLTYVGLVIPYGLALAAPHVGYPPAVLIVAALCCLALLTVAVNGRRPATN